MAQPSSQVCDECRPDRCPACLYLSFNLTLNPIVFCSPIYPGSLDVSRHRPFP